MNVVEERAKEFGQQTDRSSWRLVGPMHIADTKDQAIKDVAGLRGRLGAFQKNVLGSTINALNVALEYVASSNSAIRDTDFATETSSLTRNQILVQAAGSVLAQANSAPQSVLRLLG